MKRQSTAVSVLFVTVLFMSFIVSCSGKTVTQVEREKLFTLSYGRFDDEIDLFGLDADKAGPDTRIFMKDGMFYIANSGSQKILQLTSFGDLLSLYYNPESNPVPAFAAPAKTVSPGTPGAAGTVATSGSPDPAGASSAGTVPSEASTQKAIAYPFNHPVYLTVNSMKRLFVVDQLPSERFEFDNEDQVALRDVVLRFNPDGHFIDYLGQEGPGGAPFPPITGVYTNSKNETIVTTKTQSGIKVFWFDPEGTLLFRVPVSFKNLPSPFDANHTALASLDTIQPDPNSRRIYLKIDYYSDVIDSATGANAGISYDRSCVYPFDIDSGKYLDRIDLPSYEGSEKETAGNVSYRKPYEFLGITSNGWIFLITPQEGGYALEMLDYRSKRSQKRILAVKDDELAYNALMLSPDGIISALLATPYDASIVWWRTDALIGEIRR